MSRNRKLATTKLTTILTTISLLFALSSLAAPTATRDNRDALAPLANRTYEDHVGQVGQLRAVVDFPVVSERDATVIARTFVTLRANSGERPEWSNATIASPTAFRTSAGRMIAYDFPVSVAASQRGDVLVGATRGTSAVISYSTEGPSFASLLLDRVSAALGHNALPSRATFFYGGGNAVGIRYALATDDVPVKDDDLAVVGGTLLYSPDYRAPDDPSWQVHFAANFQITEDWATREDDVRRGYVSRNGGVAAQAILPQAWLPPAIHRVVKQGAASFPQFWQESRKWSNGTCYAGCSPTAATILFEFYDRNGYPKSIGSDSANRQHTTPTDTDVRSTIDALRTAMGTFCSSDGQGSTYTYNISSGVTSYARGRGYTFSASNSYVLMWLTLIGQIDAGRPVLLSFSLGNKAGHTVVVYEYTDDWGTSNDTVCYMMGWQTPATRCSNVYSSTDPWTAVTSVQPK